MKILDNVDPELFEDYQEYQYREYLETEREARIDAAKASIAAIHIEPIGSDESYTAYEDLLDHVDRLKKVDRELIKLCGYWDRNPKPEQTKQLDPVDPDPQPEIEEQDEPEIMLNPLPDIENPGPYPSEEEAEELALEEKEAPKPYLVPDEEHLEPIGEFCPVCGEPGYMEGECSSCGFDEAEGIECPNGLIKPLDDLEKCKGCASYKRKYGPNPALCNWNHWILEPEAFKHPIVEEAIAQ